MYTPSSRQIANAVGAIPGEGEAHTSANQIYLRQQKPRLPLAHVREMLESLAAAGKVERFEVGRVGAPPLVVYRRCTPRRGLAAGVSKAYNGDQRNQFSLNAQPDRFLQAMYPLRLGKSVALWMDASKMTLRKQYRGATRKLVILSPGQLVKMPKHTVLVSIIGSGSCIVPIDNPSAANLVLAGMPVKLAQQLVGTIQRVLKE